MKTNYLTIATGVVEVNGRYATLEICHNRVNDRYDSWFYFDDDRNAKFFMFGVSVDGTDPNSFLALVEASLDYYIPLIMEEEEENHV